MSLVLLLVAIWLLTTLIAVWIAVGLARAAARADEVEREGARASLAVDKRTGPADRRGAGRPWPAASPGRRREDVLRAELAEAHERIAELEARLEDAEADRRREAG